MNGKAVRSCIIAAGDAHDAEIVTLEGLGTRERMHPLQRAFVEEEATQCGYCMSGMIMQAKAFLDSNPKPSETEIRSALANNLCRCGSHAQIVRALQRAAAF
jgi:nicotinate dehydrogenase subunit A